MIRAMQHNVAPHIDALLEAVEDLLDLGEDKGEMRTRGYRDKDVRRYADGEMKGSGRLEDKAIRWSRAYCT